MRGRRVLALTLASWALTAGACLAQEPSRDTTRFVWLRPRDGGAANVVSPLGGEYVYSAGEANARQTPQRLLLGPMPRQSYSLFSADEEAALYALRERLLHPNDRLARPSPRKAVHKASVNPKLPDLRWPRVEIREGQTCVPTLPFADAPDWRDHLVCWSEEARDVH